MDNRTNQRLINRRRATKIAWAILGVMIFSIFSQGVGALIKRPVSQSLTCASGGGVINHPEYFNDTDFTTYVNCSYVAGNVWRIGAPYFNNLTFTGLEANASNIIHHVSFNTTIMGASPGPPQKVWRGNDVCYYNATQDLVHIDGDYTDSWGVGYHNSSTTSSFPYGANVGGTLKFQLVDIWCNSGFSFYASTANITASWFENWIEYDIDNTPVNISEIRDSSTTITLTDGVILNDTLNSELSPDRNYVFKVNNTEDSVLDSCWYSLNGGTNTTYSCTKNAFSSADVQNIPTGDNTIHFWARNDVGSTILKTLDFNFYMSGLNENSQTYNVTTYEMSLEPFQINITYDSTYYNGIFTIFTYNNTNYSATKTGTGDTILFTKSLIVPLVSATTNLSFYWTTTYSNATDIFYYTSQVNNQTVYNLGVDDCSVYTNEIFNFTLRDEETKDEINGTHYNSSIEIDLTISNPSDSSYYIRYYNNFTANTNPRICMENLTFGNRIDATISYTADNYVTEYYYLENYIMENVTSKLPNNIGLYDLLTDDATSYLLTYQDCNYLVGKDKIIQVWRRYVEDGNYLLVEMTRTDVNGQGVSHLVSEDIEYKYIVLDEGVVEWETETFRALCTATPCQISIKQTCPIDDFIDYTQEEDFTYALTLTQSTRTVELVYTIPSGASATIGLNVTQLDYLMNNTICTETQTGAGGTLTCVIPSTLNNRTYYVEVFKDNEFIEDAYFSLDTNPVDEFGVWGVVLSGFLILTFGLMFIATGWGVVIAAVFGFIVSMVLSLVAFSWTIMIWLAVAGAIIVWKISKKVGTG